MPIEILEKGAVPVAFGAILLLGVLWREYIVLRNKYDKLLESGYTCIAQNTTALNTLREHMEIYPTIQRLEDALADNKSESRRVGK